MQIAGEKSKVASALYKHGLAQEDNEFELTEEQKSAVHRIAYWYRYGRSLNRAFVLAGAAGTGKSSIIPHILEEIGCAGSSICCAYTGKAVLNMRRKGVADASTMHSVMYDCRIKRNGDYLFRLKESLPYSLVIVDEASMIGSKIYNDLMSFGKPVLFIGDHCQLPPIGDDGFNLMKNPDFTLTQIHRQAEESPIIRASQLAIKGKPIPFCEFGGFRKIHLKDLEDTHMLWADQIVTGTNARRHAVNDVMRELKGYATDGDLSPKADERMIVLQNNPYYGIFNGQIMYLEENAHFYNGVWESGFVDEIDHDEIVHMIVRSSKDKSIQFKLGEPSRYQTERKFAYMDYGYAISCHKAQGSGWDKVLVIDDGFGQDEETRRRWLYTAITRAKNEIVIASK